MRNSGAGRVILETCTFETERLLVKEWHSLSSNDWDGSELAPLVTQLLTEGVTRTLPPPWQGTYTIERAQKWIADRDAEGTTLLVIDKATRRAIGLMILFASREGNLSADVDVRLGYLLAETSWGQGFASELVAGLVGWCRGQNSISSITGGVAPDNPASARVLLKNGFEPLESSPEPIEGDQLYRVNL